MAMFLQLARLTRAAPLARCSWASTVDLGVPWNCLRDNDGCCGKDMVARLVIRGPSNRLCSDWDAQCGCVAHGSDCGSTFLSHLVAAGSDYLSPFVFPLGGFSLVGALESGGGVSSFAER